MQNWDIFNQIRLNKQRVGTIDTICKKCGKYISFRIINKDTCDFTELCQCGCAIYKYNKPDQFHEHEYYLRSFVSSRAYDSNFKNLDSFEKKGFRKIEGKEKTRYLK